MRNNKILYKITAFTLAETLITLLVIGIVVVLTIPALMQQVGEYTLKKQRDVFGRKFEEGLQQMRVDGKLEVKYESTEDFINELKKYFKIAQICSNNELQNCFVPVFSATEPGVAIKYSGNNGKKDTLYDNYSTTKITLSSGLKANDISPKINFNTSVVGIVFVDGIQMLLAYNPNCEGAQSGDTNGNVFSCIKYAADVNARKAPNIVSRDIVSNIIFTDTISFEIASAGALSYGSKWSPLKNETDEIVNKYNLQYLSSLKSDCWGGAMKYCQDLNEDGGGWKLPSPEQLAAIAKAIYGNADCVKTNENFNGFPYYGVWSNSAINNGRCYKEKTTSSPMWQQINGTSTSAFYLWSDSPNSDSKAGGWRFEPDYSNYTNFARSNNYKALCVR